MASIDDRWCGVCSVSTHSAMHGRALDHRSGIYQQGPQAHLQATGPPVLVGAWVQFVSAQSVVCACLCRSAIATTSTHPSYAHGDRAPSYIHQGTELSRAVPVHEVVTDKMSPLADSR
jgi:hypothetical protein